MVLSKTPEYPDNGLNWIKRKTSKRNQTNYPYVKISHFTEPSIISMIISSGELHSSNWSLSGIRKTGISFCYFTDLDSVNHVWNFFSIAMERKKYPEGLYWETDEGLILKCRIRKENRKLSANLDFLVDMRLVSPNPVIAQYKNYEELWEIFVPNIFLIH